VDVVGVRVGHRRIAEMTARSSTARDIPAAPSLFERTAVIGHVVPEPRHDRAIVSAWNAVRQEARNAEADCCVVTLKAAVLTVQLRHRYPRLRQGVEHRTLLWILCRDFDEAIPHPCDQDRVVEENRAWIRWPDQRLLQARLREHRDLRVDRYVQRLE